MDWAAEELVRELRGDPDWRARLVHVEKYDAREPRFTSLQLHPVLEGMLKARGVGRMYSHQAEAIQAIRAGAHTAVATPTASGKSLIYLLPVWESASRESPCTPCISPR